MLIIWLLLLMMSIFVCELRGWLSNVYSPFAELYHHESVSRGADTDPVNAKRFERRLFI